MYYIFTFYSKKVLNSKDEIADKVMSFPKTLTDYLFPPKLHKIHGGPPQLLFIVK